MSGGIQVSFWKAVEALKGPPLSVPHDTAVRELSKALSERQWKQLAASRPRNGVPR